MALRYRCVDGITANVEHCRAQVQNSIGLVTALVPRLGYDTCSQLARDALATNKRVYDLVLETGLLSQTELNHLLDPENMAGLAKSSHNVPDADAGEN